MADYPPIRIYVKKIENKNTFKIKTDYDLELLIAEKMKLFGITKNKDAKNENGENVPHLEIALVVLVYCNIVNNRYQHDSRVLYTFVPNKSIGHMLHVSHRKWLFLKVFYLGFSYTKV